MRIRRLVMLSKEYPTDRDPIYSFVDQLACGFAEAGVEVTVIAPLSLTRALRHGKALPERRLIKTTPGGGRVSVLRPLTLSFSDFKGLGLDMPVWNHRLFKRAARRALRALPRPDILYGHFIALAGASAAELGAELGVPSFLGYGESSPGVYAAYDKAFLRRALSSLSGVVSVSGENARELRAQHLLVEHTPIEVFPNAVDAARFHPMDRAQARRDLGFPQDAFIVGFVGAFSERKGVRVLSEALGALPGVRSVFIGRGALPPDCPGILFRGALPHEDIPRHLAACDAFALPTLAEGCCNAIVEALCMGLPVVSSALPFNDDILNDANSILVDPTNARQLAAAIARLRDDPALRARLGEGALASSRELEIGARVQKILRFMESCTEDK